MPTIPKSPPCYQANGAKGKLRIPEIAFVTDIRGECNAGATPHTTRYPMSPARPNVKKLLMNAGPATFPRAITPPIPAVTVATSLEAFCHGVIALVSATSAAWAALGAVTGGGRGRGAGGNLVPLCRTMDPRTTSSSRLMAKRLFSPIESRNFVMLFEYSVEDCVGSREGRSVYPGG